MNPSWIKRAEMTLSNGRFDQQLMGNTFGQPKENGQRWVFHVFLLIYWRVRQEDMLAIKIGIIGNCRASHTGDAIRVIYSSVSVGVVHVLGACAQVQGTG